MARGADCGTCAPCPQRAPILDACANALGLAGPSNGKRALSVLRILGLHFGSILPAHALLRLVFKRIMNTPAVCARDNECPSVWCDPCGESNREQGNDNYRDGRRLPQLLEKLG